MRPILLSLLVLVVACNKTVSPAKMKEQLLSLAEEKAQREVEAAEAALNAPPIKDELAYLDATLASIGDAVACAKRESSLEEAALEEKCKLSVYLDLSSRKAALLAPLSRAKAHLASLQKVSPSQQKLPTGRSARCQSCHLVTSLPGFAATKDEQEKSLKEPFLTHPMLSPLLEKHPIERFGCQSCHAGDEEKISNSAHQGMLWEPPNTSHEPHVWQRRATVGASPTDWLQSSCVQCHTKEMSLFAEVSCQSDEDCGGQQGFPDGYVCGTFEQRASEALSLVPVEIALAKSKEQDVDKLTEELMKSFLEDPRAAGSKLEDAKYAASDATKAALDDKKTFWEAVAAGRAAAQELIDLPWYNEAPEAKLLREERLKQRVEKNRPLGNGGALFASLSSNTPTQKLCVEEKTNLARVDLAPLFTKGKMILREAGCYGCHPIPGTEELPKPGPALDRLSQKTTLSWISAWISNPKDFRPNTRMPNFFPEAIEVRSLADGLTLSGLPIGRYFGFEGKVPDPKKAAHLYEPAIYQLRGDALAQRERESMQMAAYLLSVSKEDVPKGVGAGGDPEKGKLLFESRGCIGCHQAEPRPVYVPTLPEDGQDSGAATDEDPNLTKPYQNAYSHFDIAPNLSNIGAKTNEDWLFTWIKEPKLLQPDTRMPSLRLSDEDTKDIAAYLMTLTGEAKQVSEAIVPNQDAASQGKALIEKYGCYQCHLIPGFEERPKVAPDLSSFGAKTKLSFGDVFSQPEEKTWERWTEQKLLHPRTLDPKATMPHSQLRPDEVYSLLIVLRGMRQDTPTSLQKQYKPEEIARQEGRFLVSRYNCWGCHTLDGKESQILRYFEETPLYGDNAEIRRSLGPPSLLGEGERVRAEWLISFLRKVFELRPALPKSITLSDGRQSGIRMPSFDMPQKEAEVLAAYFAAMSQKPYPEQPREQNNLTYEEALEGRALFNSAQCKSCHPFEGIGQGPNLILAKERLQGDWILRWLLSPARTLPGTTKMPPFFGDPDDVLRGKLSTPLPNLEGDAAKQMIRIRDYVMVISDCPPDETQPCRVGSGTTLPASVPTSTPVNAPESR